jgi:hypothetical protein
MSNVAGKAYAMSLLTPMRPWKTPINTFLFMVSRVIPATLSGLLGLEIIHFARWVMVRRNQWPDYGQGPEKLGNDYMFFISNFNGTWDQYIDAFSDGIPNGLDLFWYSSTKFPQSIPITAFKDYIRHNQITTDYYYNATPGSAQRDIKSALRVMAVIKELEAKHPTASPEQFSKLYQAALYSVQNDLGSPGYAPIASNDTERADTHRAKYVLARWGTPASPNPPPPANLTPPQAQTIPPLANPQPMP